MGAMVLWARGIRGRCGRAIVALAAGALLLLSADARAENSLPPLPPSDPPVSGSTATPPVAGSTATPPVSPPSADAAQEGAAGPQPPPQFTTEIQPRWRFVKIGALLLGISYGATAMFSGIELMQSNSSDAWAWGLVPVVGPFAGIAYVHEDEFPLVAAVIDGYFVIDGLAQATGATFLIYGLASRQAVQVPVHQEPVQEGLWRFVPRPLHLGPRTAVFGLRGTF